MGIASKVLDIIISIGAAIVASAIIISVVIVMSAFAIFILYSVVSGIVNKIKEVLEDGKID